MKACKTGGEVSCRGSDWAPDESVRLVNELDPKPLFNLVVGDIVDGQGHHEDFRAMKVMETVLEQDIRGLMCPSLILQGLQV